MAPEAAATPPRVAVTASVVTRTPRLTSKGHRPPAHSRVLTEHLVIPVNVASALRPGPRFCPAHDGLPVTSPAAHPHPCSPHPRSALAGEPDGPGEGVRPSRASRGGPTSRHLAPSETRCPRFQTTARKWVSRGAQTPSSDGLGSGERLKAPFVPGLGPWTRQDSTVEGLRVTRR